MVLPAWLTFHAWPVVALDWIVVPYGVSNPAPAARAADRLVRALADRRLVVASQHELRDLFLERSRPYAVPDPQLSKSIADARRRALDHATYGRRDAARRAAEEAMRAAEETPEALRDSDVARHVLDACLAVVRVDLQERDRVLAVQDAQRCRRLVPDLAPRESTHSAEVVGALAEAENELRRAGASALSIETGASQPCAVFVNGRRLGTAPFRYEHAAFGPSAVFLECGAARSRVHRVTLGESERTLWIDPGSEARVSVRDVIALVYTSEQELTDNLAADAHHLAASLHAMHVVLVRELTRETFAAARYDLERKQLVASLHVDAKLLLGADAAPATQAAEALALEHREAPIPLAFREQPATPAAVSDAPATRATDGPALPAKDVAQDSVPRGRRRRVWTWSFGAASLAAGAAALGTGLVVRDRVEKHRECVAAESGDCDALKQQGGRYQRASNALIGVAGGLAVATVAAFFIERQRLRVAQISLRAAPGGLGIAARF
jgi:hypothetical protein